VGCPLQPDLVDASCSESCAPDAVRACGRAVHLTHELTLLSFQSCSTCPPGRLSIRHQSREQPTSSSIRQCTKSCDDILSNATGKRDAHGLMKRRGLQMVHSPAYGLAMVEPRGTRIPGLLHAMQEISRLTRLDLGRNSAQRRAASPRGCRGRGSRGQDPRSGSRRARLAVGEPRAARGSAGRTHLRLSPRGRAGWRVPRSG
jgi:hypothetical protein